MAVKDRMTGPFDFANAKLNEDEAGLAGFAFIAEMKKDRSLDQIISLLKQGQTFTEAFAAAKGQTPAEFFGSSNKRRRKQR